MGVEGSDTGENSITVLGGETRSIHREAECISEKGGGAEQHAVCAHTQRECLASGGMSGD
jgi:hypothetical protein